MIRRGRSLLVQKRRIQQVQRAAREHFLKLHPTDPILWMVLAEELPIGSIVGVAYGAGENPPPYRFFRVGSDGLTVTPLGATYWPSGWGPHRQS